MTIDVSTEPRFTTETYAQGMYVLYLEHVEIFFRDGHGPDEHVWARYPVGTYNNRGDVQKAAMMLARDRGWKIA